LFMRRLIYVSTFAKNLTLEDLENIGEVSIRNNAQVGITGALFTFKGVFYQILEGDEEKVARCYERIKGDPRHENLFCLEDARDVEKSDYENWSMRPILLNQEGDRYAIPFRQLLDAFLANQKEIRKYVDNEIVEKIAEGKRPEDEPIHQEDCVVIFSDLFSFTSLTKVLSSEQLLEILNIFYALINDAVVKGGGIITKLMGDGILAYAPSAQSDNMTTALIEALEKMRQIREEEAKPEHRFLYAGVGLSVGSVLKCNIGTATIRDYTILGDAVNMAVKLESLTRAHGCLMLIDEKCYQKIDNCPAHAIGKYNPSSAENPTIVYKVERHTLYHDMATEEYRALIKNFKP